MPGYLVTLDRTKGGRVLKNGANAVVVFAASGAIAKEMAGAAFDGDGSSWTEATATEIAVAADWAGWTFRATVADVPGAVFEVVADATTNTVDEIGAALVLLANAHEDIAGAEYNSTTNVLTVAAIADALGDKQLVVEIIPPGGFSSITGLVGAIVDGGIAGAVLTVALPADAAVIPSVPVALAGT